MNIFNIYLNKILDLIDALNQDHMIELSDDVVPSELPKYLDRINVDVAPIDFDFDISTNVAMVLSKPNKKAPLEIAEILIPYLKEDKNIEKISAIKPGFINIKFNNKFWNNFLKEIIINEKKFGVNKNQKKYYQ